MIAEKTLQKRKYLSDKVDSFRQRKELTLAHHIEVAGL
jgi:hypothetical protein